jgi:hypothetical protein
MHHAAVIEALTCNQLTAYALLVDAHDTEEQIPPLPGYNSAYHNAVLPGGYTDPR